MKNLRNLRIKIKRFLKKSGYGDYLHHFGPKTYEFVDHIIALLLLQALRASLRRTEKLSKFFGNKCPSYSALCKSRKKIKTELWQQLLVFSAGLSSGKLGIDGTGISKLNPSFHYLNRIDSKNPKDFAKLSALFDLQTKKFFVMRIRKTPRHDMQDVKYLLKRISELKELYGDTGYCAEWLHEFCFWKGIQTYIKPRKNVKMRGFRKIQMKNYSEEEYHRRSLIESGFGSLKRKYGGDIRAKKIWGIKSEVFCKGICHNLNLTAT